MEYSGGVLYGEKYIYAQPSPKSLVRALRESTRFDYGMPWYNFLIIYKFFGISFLLFLLILLFSTLLIIFTNFVYSRRSVLVT